MLCGVCLLPLLLFGGLQRVALLQANPRTRLFSSTTEGNSIQVCRGDGGGGSSRGKESQTETDPLTAAIRGAKAVALRAGTVVQVV